jgi:hypothetical protein
MELVVTMALTMIIGGLTTTFFVSSMHATYTSVGANQNDGEARLALDSWTSMLRVAGWWDPAGHTDRFEEITPTKIVFFANLDNRTDPATGAVIAGPTVQPATKVALMLRQSTSGAPGQLIQVIFGADNTSVLHVDELALQATMPTGPGTSWMFVPYDESGGAVDLSQPMCMSGGNYVTGLCLRAPAGTGMHDPTVSPSTLSVTAGSLTGDGTADGVLDSIGRIDINLAAQNPTSHATTVLTSAVSVNSGYPS